MLALSTIAVLVAGSTAAELRGVTETTSVVTPTTQTFNIKETGLLAKKVQEVTDVNLAEHPPGEVAGDRGYVLEWTRVNTDCSGRVEFVGGLSSGATHTIFGDADASITFYANAEVTGSKTEAGTFKLQTYTSTFPDGADGAPYVKAAEVPLRRALAAVAETRCTQAVSRQIPYDEVRIDEHKGYFYGHTLVKGEYSAVTSSLNGFYEELYGNKNECILGVHPVAFAVHWVKGECYFNANTLEDKQDVMDKPIAHNWFKIHGVNTTSAKIVYTVHNNDECVDKNPFDKANRTEVATPAALNTCVLVEKATATANRDEVATNKFWVKYKGYN